MEKRKLGNSELLVAPLAFGGNVFGWTIDEDKSFKILDAFIDSGANLIDTADVYSRWVPDNQGGESEKIIGNWLKKTGNRDKIVLATKVGSDMGDEKKGLSKKHIIQAVEDSLKRLQTDYIDLYQSHVDDKETEIEETLEAYSQLFKQGKIRYIGASNFDPERLTQSVEISKKNNYPSYQSLQPLYNLYDREAYEKELAKVTNEHNIGVITYFSLASGFLTGKYCSEADFNKSKRGQGMKKYLNQRGFKILEALDKVAQENNSNPAQISLAWLIAQTTVTSAIASATSLEQLKDLIQAMNLKLSDRSIQLLTEASK